MPFTFTTNDAVVAGFTNVVDGARHRAGTDPNRDRLHHRIMGIARLRPRFASLVGLSEVMFAVLASLAAAR